MTNYNTTKTPDKILILSGAGISAPSGIQTFRGSDGLWNGYKVEEVATPYAFDENPNRVHQFYNERREDIRSKKPNKAHIALARLYESELDFKLVTQNIDDLHERGGVEEVIHMHGEIFKKRCLDCGYVDECRGNTSVGDLCQTCSGKVRPDIVWFGEMPFHLNSINHWLKTYTLFAAIGTSGQVHPAAEFVKIAKAGGAHTIEFNLENTTISRHFDEVILGDVEETIPAWVSSILD